MRLFISYARVDKHRCKQIIDLLDMHDVWYDQRLHIGQKWWDEIVKRLHWCDGFVFLLSPVSLASEYCKRELEIAISLKKRVFPVVIEPGTEVPSHLTHIQYADLSNGLDVNMVKTLLSAIFIAERQLRQVAVEQAAAVGAGVASASTAGTPAVVPGTTTVTTPAATPIPVPIPASEIVVPTKADGKTMLDDAVRALRSCDYDKAVFLLKQVQESGYMSRFINVHSMLREAEASLERQAYVREAQREYAPIALLMKDEATRSLGCTAFRAFQATFPDYDPDNLKAIYEQTILTQPPFDLNSAMPLLEWCRIPAGKAMTERNRSRKSFEIAEFFMSKYPVTNAQFQSFIDAPDGYKNPVWWQSSLEVRRWHADHLKAIEATPNQPTHPRTYVCWYEATAFCQWLSYKTGWTVKLPTEQQWQRAAQGDNGYRFPWGSRFDATLCTTKESETKGSTPVTQYPKSASPYGVCDLLGNVWEWCSNGTASGEITDVTVDILRVVRGGSFMSPKKRTNINFHYFLNPLYRYQSIGFRIVCETGAEFLGV
jgi:formylglycine-generating enzyme required for sulfatase activity